MSENESQLDINNIRQFARAMGTGFYWIVLTLVFVGLFLVENVSALFIIAGLFIVFLAHISIERSINKIGELTALEGENDTDNDNNLSNKDE